MAQQMLNSYTADLIKKFNDPLNQDMGNLLFTYGREEFFQKNEFVLKKLLDKSHWNDSMIFAMFDILRRLKRTGLLQPQSNDKNHVLVDPNITQTLLANKTPAMRQKMIKKHLSGLKERDLVFMTHSEHEHWFLVVLVVGIFPITGILSSVSQDPDPKKKGIPMDQETKKRFIEVINAILAHNDMGQASELTEYKAAKQTNTNDCGIFVASFVKEIMKQDPDLSEKNQIHLTTRTKVREVRETFERWFDWEAKKSGDPRGSRKPLCFICLEYLGDDAGAYFFCRKSELRGTAHDRCAQAGECPCCHSSEKSTNSLLVIKLDRYKVLEDSYASGLTMTFNAKFGNRWVTEKLHTCPSYYHPHQINLLMTYLKDVYLTIKNKVTTVSETEDFKKTLHDAITENITKILKIGGEYNHNNCTNLRRCTGFMPKNLAQLLAPIARICASHIEGNSIFTCLENRSVEENLTISNCLHKIRYATCGPMPPLSSKNSFSYQEVKASLEEMNSILNHPDNHAWKRKRTIDDHDGYEPPRKKMKAPNQ